MDEFPSLSWGSSSVGEPRGLAQGLGEGSGASQQLRILDKRDFIQSSYSLTTHPSRQTITQPSSLC